MIDPELFDEWLAKAPELLRQSDELIQNLELPVLHLQYEQLLVEPQATIDRIFSFLGVQSVEFHSELKKNTSDNLRDVVENFDELKERYVGTQFEHMFDEVLVQT